MKNNRLLLSLVCSFILVCQSAFAQESDSGIQFEKLSFNELKKKAAAESKLLFIDCYTTWCGPCKLMSKTIFPDPVVGEFYNAHFINAKIDMEKGEGPEIAKKYNVNSYPTYLFMNGNGELVHRAGGSMPSADFIAVGEDAGNPDHSIFNIREKVDKSTTEPELLYRYLLGSMMADLEIDPEIRQLAIDNINESSVRNPYNLKMLLFLSEGTQELKKIIALQNQIIELIGQDSIGYFFTNFEKYQLASVAGSDDKSAYPEYKELLRKVSPTRLEQEERERKYWEADLQYAARWKDADSYMSTAGNGVYKYYNDNSDQLNSIAWTVTEISDSREHLLEADKWITRSIEINENYYNLDTKAWIQYKLGNIPLAKTLAQKAINAAKKAGESPESYKSTSELLKKLK